MTGLRVVPAVSHGQQRLHVCLPDGMTVAWFDRESARVHLIFESRRDDVLRALGPFLSGPVTVGPPPVPTPAELAGLALHPDDDLAPNRPGEALVIALDRDPAPSAGLRRDPRPRALAAERAIGESLDGLAGAGWRALHSIALPGGARIHHLLIGPGGLFCVRTLHAGGRRVRIDDPMVTVGRRTAVPELRRIRQDADRASFALAADVRPVLALVETARVEEAHGPRGIRVVTDADLTSLAHLAGVLKPADVESLYALARDRHTWLRL
ncbi:nuclease-related domain-containing protein [Streptomyces tsukubensis]|uniref:NERD domain-containing protein n=1 Tax=Streptomyces tsukubensis TaxID=83656 RepID=A0A1V4ACJ7_9ACTN|nr:nuclease-related domain-containing protein [Streptomyces tsukubensis]OON81180.1 hypothetical protein B1H18_07365 [Streptomyces tsukubensis]QFR95706.1 NERD domain-containing protein [Streptomyces tsukubensis]